MGRNRAAMAAAAYFILAAGTIYLTSNGRNIATIWPANAVLLAILLDAPRRRDWPSVLIAGFVANAAANLLLRGPNVGSVAYGICNLFEVALAASLLRPTLRNMDILGAPAVVGRFIVIAGGIAPLFSASMGATVASVFFGERFDGAFVTWYCTDALGLMLFTPFFRSAFRGAYVDCFLEKTWLERAEALGHQLLAGALAFAAFFVATRPLLFALFAPVMLTTCRVGRLGTKLSVIIIGTIGAIATVKGVGPIVALSPDPREQSLLFQGFLATLLLTCLPAAADLTAQKAKVASLNESAAEASEREVELTFLATRDTLTGVLNRRAFRQATEAAMTDGRGPLSLIALDLDHFKQVNDEHGHTTGDQALVHLVGILQSGLRETDMLGRIGGDEFLILLPSTTPERAAIIADRLTQSLAQAPLASEDRLLSLSMSTGIASFSEGMLYDDLTDAADRALYERKRTRNVDRHGITTSKGYETVVPISSSKDLCPQSVDVRRAGLLFGADH